MNNDGIYTNPILYVDYSDPDVVRVGDDYFMVASSFCNSPGLPLLHSRDLVNWTLINYCIKTIPGDKYDKPLHGCGVWAPAIRYFNGEFIVFFPMPDDGIYVVKTKDPWGEWDEPYCLISTKGWIDPCPFWDEDGKAYMVNAFAKSRIGFKSILQLIEMTPDCTKLIGEPKYIFDGNVEDEETIEGPKLYKKNGYYYIFAPAGGVKQGWQTVLRSKNIWGPYEKKRVCMQMDTNINGPHQGAWVDTVTGEDWFIHFQDVYAAGRITHLQPMRFENDWPIIGEGEGKPVLTHKKPEVNNGGNLSQSSRKDSRYFNHEILDDNFDTHELKYLWQWNANFKKDFYEMSENGIALKALYKKCNSIADLPNLLLQKWCRPEFTVKTELELKDLIVGDVSGLISLGVEYGAVAVRRNENEYAIISIKGEQKFINEMASSIDNINIIKSLPITLTKLYFACQVEKLEPNEVNTDGPFAFDIPRERITLYYSLEDKNYTKVCSFEAKAGRWVGVKHGIFAYNETCEDGGSACYNSYRYVKNN